MNSPIQMAVNHNRIPSRHRLVTLTGDNGHDADVLDTMEMNGWDLISIIPPSSHNVHATVLFTRPDPVKLQESIEQQAVMMKEYEHQNLHREFNMEESKSKMDEMMGLAKSVLTKLSEDHR